MRTIFSFAVAALTSVVLVTPAAAEQVSAAVPYADLDLSTPNGRAVLADRAKQTVRRLCGSPQADSIDNAVYRHCVRQAWAAVRPQIARAQARQALALGGQR